MPDNLLADVPPREHTSWRDWAALLLVVGLGLGIWHVDAVSTRAQQAASTATTVSLENRAAICDFIRQFGGIEPKVCTSPEVRRYRDPRITVSDGTTTQLLCKILTTLKTTAPGCGAPRAPTR